MTLAAIACGSPPAEESPSSHELRLIEEDGVPVALNVGGPRFADEIFTYEKELELRPDPAHDESYLGRPTTFTVDDQGFFHVPDSDAHRIAVFDAEGRFVRTWGRQGQGPGDLYFPSNPRFQDELLHIFNFSTQAVDRFRPDGSFVDQLAYREGGRLSSIHRLEGGTLVAMEFENVRDETGRSLRWNVFLVGADGELVTKLQEPLIPSSTTVNADVRVYSSSTGTWSRQNRPVEATLQYTGRPVGFVTWDDEIVLGDGREPVLRVYDGSGTLVRKVRVEWPAAPVTEAERERMRAELEAAIDVAPEQGNEMEGIVSRDALQRRLDTLRFADRKGFASWGFPEPSGHAWLRIPSPSRVQYQTPDPDQRWRVIDPEGEYLGDTTWPPVFEGRVVDGRLLAIGLDEETGERVPLVYRIRPAVQGLGYPESR